MVFTTEKIPYAFHVGIDLSKYENLIIQNSLNILPDLITKLDEYKIDYIISNISVKNNQTRISSINNFTSPIYLDDYSLFSYEWRNKFAGKLHDEDFVNLKNNVELLKMDLDYSNHINTKFTVFNNKNFSQENSFLLCKLLKKFLTDNPDRSVNIIVPFTKEGMTYWQQIQSETGYLENLGVIIEIYPDLPDESLLTEFCSHNLKSVILPFSIFITNKNGFPVLSKLHQDYLKFLFGFKIDVIFYDDNNLLINEINLTNYDLKNFAKVKDYYLYVCHLFSIHREFKNQDYILFNYLDTFQIPLQPLRDNLLSQTYECFEEDNTKYDFYEKAVSKALLNYKEKGFLNLDNLKNNQKSYINTTIDNVEGNSQIVSNNDTTNKRILTACVLGGGRGPLVRNVVTAALKNGFIIGENFNIICVEKNRNAFNTLLSLKIKEPEIFGNVNFIFSDMRDFKPDYKLDIIVSELLGSFGDNELSPECLLNIQEYLSSDSIMVPYSYTSYIRPVTCPVIWANIKKLKESYQSQYVILLHKAYYPIKEVAECFTFTHPVRSLDFNLYKEFNFKFNSNVIIYGFAGYFRTVLYDDVELSTVPYDHTPGLFSWFPIYFPSMVQIIFYFIF